MRLNVERRGPHALITKDNLRVDLSAEFYIKVQANKEDILQAARSLGSKNTDPGAVSEFSVEWYDDRVDPSTQKQFQPPSSRRCSANQSR